MTEDDRAKVEIGAPQERKFRKNSKHNGQSVRVSFLEISKQVVEL
jgi:hypothetical protein